MAGGWAHIDGDFRELIHRLNLWPNVSSQASTEGWDWRLGDFVWT